jgi:hypothetical protein
MGQYDRLDNEIARELLRELKYVDTFEYPNRLPNRDKTALYVKHIDQLYDMEVNGDDPNGSTFWFCAKIKCAADYHEFHFRRPDGVSEEDFSADYSYLKRQRLPQPARALANVNHAMPNAKWIVGGVLATLFILNANKAESSEIEQFLIDQTPIASVATPRAEL